MYACIYIYIERERDRSVHPRVSSCSVAVFHVNHVMSMFHANRIMLRKYLLLSMVLSVVYVDRKQNI